MLNFSCIWSISKFSLCTTDKSKARLLMLGSEYSKPSSLGWVSNYKAAFIGLPSFTSLNIHQTGKHENQKLRIFNKHCVSQITFFYHYRHRQNFVNLHVVVENAVRTLKTQIFSLFVFCITEKQTSSTHCKLYFLNWLFFWNPIRNPTDA
jgi:hypothetical protein